MRRLAGEVLGAALAIAAIFWLLEARGRAAERATQADARAQQAAAEARQQEAMRRAADAQAQAVRDSARLERQRQARQLAAARADLDHLLAQPPETATVDTAGLLERIRERVQAERRACDLSIATCEQMRAAAELRADRADRSARGLDSALAAVGGRLTAAIRRAHRPAWRRGLEAAALAGCVVAGVTIGSDRVGTATLAGGAACLLELAF